MSKFLVYLLCGLSLVGGGLAGCSAPSAPSEPVAADEVSEGVGEERDAGTLKLLYSRIPTTLNPHLANGYQDFEVARIVYEPLASYNSDGGLMPILADAIPTQENGGLSDDGRTVTWRLRKNVTWSDGKPFTAADVVFTYQFVSQPETAAATAKHYEDIEKVEAVDDYTVKLTFKQPTPAWQLPFTGQNGMVFPKHIFENYLGDKARQAPANLQPVGTGPYRFISNAQGKWLFGPNDRYWDGQPHFELLEVQGGVAPYVAARDVLKTGKADFAHNLQLEVDQLETLSEDGVGSLVTSFGSQVERIMINPTDPNKATPEGEKSSVQYPHPFLADRNVRQALDYAINRNAIATRLYGSLGKPTSQLLVTPPEFVSDKIAHEYAPDKANALLDKAGWQDTDGNGIRDKDGVEMEVKFQTSVNTVRQQTQAMVKENLEAVGIAVDIERVRIDDFFSANPSQTNSINHFYADLQEYATGSDIPDPTIYMSWWTCDEIASQANNWQKPNNARYCNKAYDALWKAAKRELDPAQRGVLFKKMDELLAQDVAVLPIVHRALVNGIHNRITGYEATAWDLSTWNIAKWAVVEAPAEGADAAEDGPEDTLNQEAENQADDASEPESQSPQERTSDEADGEE
ncbi:MAG: peptide ABC transporter substrate-binding protein [Cyanobacteria bacterium P01_G01_bin.38]